MKLDKLLQIAGISKELLRESKWIYDLDDAPDNPVNDLGTRKRKIDSFIKQLQQFGIEKEWIYLNITKTHPDIASSILNNLNIENRIIFKNSTLEYYGILFHFRYYNKRSNKFIYTDSPEKYDGDFPSGDDDIRELHIQILDDNSEFFINSFTKTRSGIVSSFNLPNIPDYVNIKFNDSKDVAKIVYLSYGYEDDYNYHVGKIFYGPDFIIITNEHNNDDLYIFEQLKDGDNFCERFLYPNDIETYDLINKCLDNVIKSYKENKDDFENFINYLKENHENDLQLEGFRYSDKLEQLLERFDPVKNEVYFEFLRMNEQ